MLLNILSIFYSFFSNELDIIRAERQITQRRVAALPEASKKELLFRKRASQLARVLLPDAPPRKTPTVSILLLMIF